MLSKEFVEKDDITIEVDEEATGHKHGNLHRQLKNRHIAMISIGGVIGTGLFLGTAGALSNGGPAGLLLGYTIMGTITYAVMVCLGEIVAYLPIAGGHIKLAERIVDPALSFAMGWNYWYNWAITLPAELSAASVLINYWISPERVNNGVWITICLVVVVGINMFGARAYGEAEFWFASIKVLTISGLIICGIIIDAGGVKDYPALSTTFWYNPGPWTQYHGIPGATGRFLGFFAVLTQAAFSYIGTEIVAIAAGEAKNPRKNIPKAVRKVYIRILLFYIIGTFIIGLLVASNDPKITRNAQPGTAAASPFVIAIQNAGIKGLDHVVNACLLTSAWSAASSDLYTSSRALYGLSISGSAPRIFSKTSKNGLPWPALTVSVLLSFLAYMNVSSDSSKVFGWFANLTSVCGLITWTGISIAYLRFYYAIKAQNIDRKSLPFTSIVQPFAGWYVLVATTIIIFFSGFSVFLEGNWNTANFVTNYLPIAVFVVLFFGYKLIVRSKLIPLTEVDLISGIREIEYEAEQDDAVPTGFWDKFWDAF